MLGMVATAASPELKAVEEDLRGVDIVFELGGGDGGGSMGASVFLLLRFLGVGAPVELLLGLRLVILVEVLEPLLNCCC